MESKTMEMLIKLAIEEDLGERGDITSSAIFKDEKSTAYLVSKGEGILAGIDVFRKVYGAIDPEVKAAFLLADGHPLSSGMKIAEITGLTLSILKGERIALNFISFLSGIASQTAEYINVRGKALIMDTRKTIPGYRQLAKYAVRIGGGVNHRMGLFDMVMIKDNHIDAAGSITEAVRRVRARWDEQFRIEVECRTLKEVEEAISLKVDIIMLDNMPEEMVEAALKMGGGTVKFESSGDMDLAKVEKYGTLGVDYISVGRLTHSVNSFNFSLLMEQ